MWLGSCNLEISRGVFQRCLLSISSLFFSMMSYIFVLVSFSFLGHILNLFCPFSLSLSSCFSFQLLFYSYFSFHTIHTIQVTFLQNCYERLCQRLALSILYGRCRHFKLISLLENSGQLKFSHMAALTVSCCRSLLDASSVRSLLHHHPFKWIPLAST